MRLLRLMTTRGNAACIVALGSSTIPVGLISSAAWAAFSALNCSNLRSCSFEIGARQISRAWSVPLKA